MGCELSQRRKATCARSGEPLVLCGHAGQGLNMTMEDAAELGWFVQQLGLLPEALRAFELERIPRVGVIVQKAQVGRMLLTPMICHNSSASMHAGGSCAACAELRGT